MGPFEHEEECLDRNRRQLELGWKRDGQGKECRLLFGWQRQMWFCGSGCKKMNECGMNGQLHRSCYSRLFIDLLSLPEILKPFVFLFQNVAIF